LCDRLNVLLHLADGSIDRDLIRRHGLEAAAREVRNVRLQEIRARVGASHIATAHQKNDQAETVLMRLITGGGLAALRGIHPMRADGVVRPLLEVTRAQIEQFLRERGIVARVDRMNSDPRFLRNRVRRVLAELDGSAIENLAAIATQARDEWQAVEAVLDSMDSSFVAATETRFRSFPEDPWLRRALLHRHIRRLDPHARDVSSEDLERIAGQLDSLKRVSVTGSLELLRRGEEWILRIKPQKTGGFEFQLRAGEAAHGVRIDRQPASGNFELPSGAEPTFIVRNRRPGDRFQPLGMQQEKKLKDFLIDRKIAVECRDRIPLLVWNGKIVCVTGVEVSEAFKVTGSGDRYEVAIEEASQESIQPEADRRPGR
ncbi:MAG TPA: tRNA lysidine(34) synthetase TilS, partial [Thermoanaerobaculia bacterium]|nr:tRNA lysidine(34) synthetase TilS [Thermoanaerobaculia bacterium]